MDNKKYTKEDIEELRQQDPSLLSPRERGLANLRPIEKGEVRNPQGRKKGVKNWATHFRRLLGDEKFLRTIISQSPREWDNIVGEYPADVIAAGIIAVVTREVAQSVVQQKALDKTTLRTIELLNKIGFGEKVVIDTEEGFFDKPQIVFQVVEDREKPSDVVE